MTEAIFDYTRAMAIADGMLIDVSHMAKNIGYKYPVAITETVYQTCVEVPPDLKVEQDEEWRLWDLLWMSCHKKLIPDTDGTEAWFEVLVQTNTDAKPIMMRINIVCGPGDTAEPVITMMMPWED